MGKSTFKSINPFNDETISEYEQFSENKVESILGRSENAFKSWKLKPIASRTLLLHNVAEILLQNSEKYAKLMTIEMGKPITQSISEVEKCAHLCNFYSKNADALLADELIETEAQESFISYDPLGIILGIMPWNYPFWQVLRFAIPTLTAGNTVLLKHASNVSGCALQLQELFETAGYPKGCFQTLLVNHDTIETIIADQRIKAISLTGSEKAGRKIAEIAGKNLKKTVLELGGNNACVVLDDADLEKHLDVMVNARMQNTGQSCIAAKRFIVVESIYDEFLKKFTKKIKQLKSGNPLNKDTNIGVLARPDLAKTLEKQVNNSLKNGAQIHFGNSKEKAFYQPTIITKIDQNMSVFTEETFGPVAAILKVKDRNEAYEAVSNSRFGLGSMIFTKDIDDAKRRIIAIEDGAFFINELVKSDPRLPFGGTKASGYGRELSREGLLEFVNKKTVYITK